MSDVIAFSLDSLQPEPAVDVQLKLLNNALNRFCDQVEEDVCNVDADRNLVTRKVTWRYGSLRFRAKLVTFDNETSIGQFDFSDGDKWQRLTTPRALAEKLTQAR
jgi:hypothetical protein